MMQPQFESTASTSQSTTEARAQEGTLRHTSTVGNRTSSRRRAAFASIVIAVALAVTLSATLSAGVAWAQTACTATVSTLSELQTALSVDAGTCSSQTITVTASIALSGTQLVFDAGIPLTVQSDGTQHVIDGIDSSRILSIANGTNVVTLKGLTFQNGTSDTGSAVAGGAVASQSPVIFDSMIFSGNKAFFQGGAAIIFGDAIIRNSIFQHNLSSEAGAILVNGDVEIVETRFYSNTAEAAGSMAIVGSSNIITSVFEANTSTMYNVVFFGDADIRGSTFLGNSSVMGAAISSAGPMTLTITGSNFISNTAGNNGDVMPITCTHCFISDSLFQGNATTGAGSVFNITGDSLTIVNSEFISNTGGSTRSAIKAILTNTITISNSAFLSNTSGTTYGGVFELESRSDLINVVGSRFAQNDAGDLASTLQVRAPNGSFISRTEIISNSVTGLIAWGGGLAVFSSTIAGNYGGSIRTGGVHSIAALTGIQDSTIANNTGGSAGGIFVTGELLGLYNSTVSGNTGTSALGGGGVHVRIDAGDTVIVGIGNSTIVSNTAPANNGGGFRFSVDEDDDLQAAAVGTSNTDLPVAVANTIIADNIGNDCGLDVPPANASAKLVPPSSMSTDLSCPTIFPDLFTQVADVKLGPLQDNGGSTWTHALLPGSPAIDSGNNDAANGIIEWNDQTGVGPLQYDQRGAGFPRIVNSTVDLGAYEYEATAISTTVIIVESYLVSRVAEGMSSGEGAQACYWLTLDADPGTASVTVDLAATPSGQLSLNKSSVTLNSGNWNNLSNTERSNFVCIRAVDDTVLEAGDPICYDGNSDVHGNGSLITDKECGDHTATISHTVAADPVHVLAAAVTADATFKRRVGDGSLVDEAAVPVLITDNEVPAGVNLTESYAVSDLDEDGTPIHQACYWVTLTSQPSQPVTVSTVPDGQVTANPTSIVLDHSNWDALGANGNRICLAPVQNSTVDGSAGSYCADKNSDIYGAGSAASQVCGSHVSHVGHTVSSADGNYGPTVPVTANGADFDSNASTVDVLLRDDDVSGLAFNPMAINALEGSTIEYTVSLLSRPSADVTVVADAGDIQAASGHGSTLVFTPETWNSPQVISLALPDNAVQDGVRTSGISHVVGSSDPNYANLATGWTTLPATVTDDDSAGAVVSRGSVSVVEGGSMDAYAVRLTVRPIDAVTILIDGSAQVVATPPQVTFTPDNWDQPQTVTIQAVDDLVDEGAVAIATIRHTTTSNDPGYNNTTISTIQAEVVDNDNAALVVDSLTTDALIEGQSRSYAVTLATQPTQQVQVFVVTDGATTADTSVLYFDTANWNVPQTVRLTSKDDDVDNAADSRDSYVNHFTLSNDPHYSGLAGDDLAVTIVDDDVAGFVLSSASAALGAQEGGSYTLALRTRPLTDVFVELNASTGITIHNSCAATTEGMAACLHFTPDTWNTPQPILFTALTAGAEVIDHSGVSSDPGYNGLATRFYINGTPEHRTGTTFLPLILR